MIRMTSMCARSQGLILAASVSLCLTAPGWAQSSARSASEDTTSRATQARARIDVENIFTPSGWMGDGEYGRKYVEVQGADTLNPHSPPTCTKIVYRFGPQRWAGVYWQNEPDNWGNLPGHSYAGRGFSAITFWARGETGTEVIEFKSGGVRSQGKKHRDSYAKTIGRVRLTTEWTEYRIPIVDLDLTSVIGAFCWVASQDYNRGEGVTFYLDDIAIE